MIRLSASAIKQEFKHQELNMQIWIAFLCATLTATTAFAETKDQSLESMSLEDLLQVKIQGGSREKKSISQSASVVSVVTAEEIRRAGARDLMDVLNLVPGLQIASDAQGTTSLAVRGIWSNEGKVLLVIDGEEMNELSYGSLQLSHRYPAESIARVEVVRGPGSAAYGGFAEIAVINVISKSAEDLGGGVAQVRYGRTSKGSAERDVSYGYGKKWGDWKLTAFGAFGDTSQSDRIYSDSMGAQFSSLGNSNRNPIYFNLGASNSIWDFRFIFDRLNTTDETAYGVNAPAALATDFQTLTLGAKATLPVTSSFSISPEIHLTQQEPYRLTDPAGFAVSNLNFNVTVQQARFGLAARAELGSNLVAHLGYEGRMIQELDSTAESTSNLFPNGLQSIVLYQNSIFTELNWETSLASITAGARYESQNYGGDQVVPRISAVKTWETFHLKALYSWGFREPEVENLRLNSNLQSETTKVAELEAGYRFTSHVFATINAYSIELDHPIIYGYASATESYQNSTPSRTYGFEYDLRMKDEIYTVDLNYSYFHTRSNEPIDYQVPGQPQSLLGVANHKAVLNNSIRLFSEQNHLNFSEIFLSSRFGYDYDSNTSPNLAVHRFPAAFLTNVFFERTDFIFPKLNLGLGVFNVLNQNYPLVQPYDGSHPPIPSSSRDWVAQLNYRTDLN